MNKSFAPTIVWIILAFGLMGFLSEKAPRTDIAYGDQTVCAAANLQIENNTVVCVPR